MKKTKTIRIPRQTTHYTCGHTSLAIVGQLLGRDISEHEIVKVMPVIPRVGLDHDHLAEYAREHYPVEHVGSDVYAGGLGIANIKNPKSHIGHYVVMLGVRDGLYRYYCPLFGQVFTVSREEMTWENGAGTLKNWAITFKSSHDFYETDLQSETHVFIIGDPIETLDAKFDTSLLLMKKYHELEQSVSWHTPRDIFTRDRTLYLSGLPVLKNDMVWMRCDPLNTVAYYEMLKRLSFVDAKILNAPKALTHFHDKLSTLWVQDNFSTYTASSHEGVNYAIRHLKVQGFDRFVIKAPSLFGGQGIFFASNAHEASEAFDKVIAASGYVIIQGFVNMGKKPVDRRILITSEKIIGVVDRHAAEGSELCNLHAGGKAQKAGPLSPLQQHMVKKVQMLMREHDIFLAGIDFLMDHLIEINVTCPSAVPQIMACGFPEADLDLIVEAYRYLDLTPSALAQAKLPQANFSSSAASVI